MDFFQRRRDRHPAAAGLIDPRVMGLRQLPHDLDPLFVDVLADADGGVAPMAEHVGADAIGEQGAVQVITVPPAWLQVPFGVGVIFGRFDGIIEFERTGRCGAGWFQERLEPGAALLDRGNAAIEIILGDIALQKPLQAIDVVPLRDGAGAGDFCAHAFRGGILGIVGNDLLAFRVRRETRGRLGAQMVDDIFWIDPRISREARPRWLSPKGGITPFGVSESPAFVMKATMSSLPGRPYR